MTWVLLAIGLVLIVEGLALALAPLRVEQILAFIMRHSAEQRRGFGLAAVTAGVVLVALARVFGLGR